MTYVPRPPTDSYGVQIETGDLVVSGGKIGIVSKINNYNAPTIRYPVTVNTYAWEWGAPDVEETYNKWNYDVYYALPTYEEKRNYKGVPTKRMVKDKRVVATRDGFYSQNRQNTSNITVIRKHDGTEPSSMLDMIERHSLLFPNSKENPNGEAQ